MGDNINHPDHYQNIAGLEAIDILDDIVKDLPGKQAAMLWNTLKYLFRFQKKNGVEDLKKAQNYLQRLIDATDTVKEKPKSTSRSNMPKKKVDFKSKDNPDIKCASSLYGTVELYSSSSMPAGTCDVIKFENGLSRDLFIASFYTKLTDPGYKPYSIRDTLFDGLCVMPDTFDEFGIDVPWRDIIKRFRMYEKDEKYILEFVYKDVVK